MTYGYDVDAFKRKWFQAGYDKAVADLKKQGEVAPANIPIVIKYDGVPPDMLKELRDENKKLREDLAALEAKYLQAASAQDAKKYKAWQVGVAADLMHQHLKTDVVAYAKSFKELPEALQPYQKRLLEGIEAGAVVACRPDHENSAPAMLGNVLPVVEQDNTNVVLVGPEGEQKRRVPIEERLNEDDE